MGIVEIWQSLEKRNTYYDFPPIICGGKWLYNKTIVNIIVISFLQEFKMSVQSSDLMDRAHRSEAEFCGLKSPAKLKIIFFSESTKQAVISDATYAMLSIRIV